MKGGDIVKEYKDFMFKIRNYEIVEIYADGQLVSEKDLIQSNLWDKYKNIESLLYCHVKGYSKQKGRSYEFYPYRFPWTFPHIDMDEAEYQKYISDCYDRLHGNNETHTADGFDSLKKAELGGEE